MLHGRRLRGWPHHGGDRSAMPAHPGVRRGHLPRAGAYVGVCISVPMSPVDSTRQNFGKYFPLGATCRRYCRPEKGPSRHHFGRLVSLVGALCGLPGPFDSVSDEGNKSAALPRSTDFPQKKEGRKLGVLIFVRHPSLRYKRVRCGTWLNGWSSTMRPHILERRSSSAASYAKTQLFFPSIK